jgi:hypothetical protein
MKSRTLTCLIAITLFAALPFPVRLAAQEEPDGVTSANTDPANPVPLINQPLVPDARKPGGAEFMLTVNGTGFVSTSVVKWNGSSQTTTFMSSSQLIAKILASDVVAARTVSVTVVNPSPGGGTSNVVFFEVTPPSSSITMSAPSTFDIETGPGSVAVGDFNGDGKLDLVVGNVFSNAVRVLLGEGNGTFQAAVDYGTGISPSAVEVGDFNGDGRLDLVVTNSCGSDRASGIGQVKCGGSCSPGHPCPSGCRCFGRCFPIVYSGYCEINDSTGMLLTDGLCVSHRYNQCYIQPSANCPKGKPAINPSDTTCGGFGIARIDLARKCSF